MVSVIPPLACKYIDSAASSVERRLIEELAVISISSAAPPADVISIPPAEALKTTASEAFFEEAILIVKVPSISTPPAAAAILIASAQARPEANVNPPTSECTHTESTPVP